MCDVTTVATSKNMQQFRNTIGKADKIKKAKKKKKAERGKRRKKKNASDCNTLMCCSCHEYKNCKL